MLRETLDHLEARQLREPTFTYEIIVVDDGSPDLTAESTLPYVREVTTEKLRILRLLRNRGKGGAVIAGALRARGQYVLFADADGATAVHEIAKLERHVRAIEKNGLAVGIGSRAHLVATDVVVQVRA
jgi:dolichyl-phosphate beta-glucosyltransferase